MFSISYIDLVLVYHNVDVVIDKVRGLFAGISSSGVKAVSLSEAVHQFEAMDWYTEEYSPYNYVGEYGAPSAIAIDILIGAFKRINVNVPAAQVKITPWADSYVRILRNPGAALFSTTYKKERLKFIKIIGP
ncbi:MAG: hypothetical protein ACKVG1_11120 [Rhodospirillales bacterium]